MNTIYTPQEAFDKLSEIEGSVIITGVIEAASDTEKALMQPMFGVGDTLSSSFKLYFHWFNIVHELSHIITAKNGIPNNDLLTTEWMVNKIATAFWRTFGDDDVYQRLVEVVKKARQSIPNPVPGNTNFEEFYANYSDMEDDTMLLYAYFQFTLVDRALSLTNDIYSVLEEYGLKTREIACDLTQYDHNSGAQEVVDAAISAFRDMGIEVPDVTVIFCSNPNVHCAPK